MGGGGSKTHQSFTVTPSGNHAGVTNADGGIAAAGVELEDLEALGVQAPDPTGAAGPTAEEGPGEVAADEDPAAAQDPAGEEDSPALAALLEPDPPMASASPAGEWEDVLTPVPEEVPAGLVTGVPLLVGGADLVDATATLVAYTGPGGPREVLVATVDEAAEAKLLEALALSETKLVPVAVQTEVSGRLPTDTGHQLYEQLVTAAKSTNHHLKDGTEVPAHTQATIAKVAADLDQLGELPAEADKAMVAHYQATVAALAERAAPGWAVPYGAGGKVPQVTPFETTGMATVTHWMPAPAEDPEVGKLTAAVRDASRIRPTLSADGVASWDGAARSAAKGKEYLVDLGDGYTAVYRPYGANDPASSEHSLRGALEVTGPAGCGHGPELVSRLGQLNLVNRPMTAAEGEWAYLRANVDAQRLTAKPAVKAALAETEGLEDAVEHVLFAQRASQAVGMSEPELHRFARQLRLDAEAKALPTKVTILREAVAKATGHTDGAALAAAAGYDPAPRASGGWLTWGRFDVDADRAAVRTGFAGKGLTHRLTGGNIVDVLRTGVLASTERRSLMGVAPGKGMSEHADKKSGGARSVFLRVGNDPKAGPALYWSDPTVLLRRADWYAYPTDHFGSLNPASGHSTNGLTRDPATVATFTGGGSNEVMFSHGIDLLGAEAPSAIRCANKTQRAEVLALFAGKGITSLGGRPVTEVVQ